MSKLEKDLAAVLAASQKGPPRTESGMTAREEQDAIDGLNRAATILQCVILMTACLAALFFGKGFLIFGAIVAYVFGASRIK